MKRIDVRAGFVLSVLTAVGCAGAKGDDPGSAAEEPLAAPAATSFPGRIQAEGYKAGGEGVGYHDTTAGNAGGVFRSDDVDIQASTDAGGGFDVGWTAAGEWLAYDVTVTQGGTYALTARLASAVTGSKTLHFEVDGAAVPSATATFSGGDGWQSWKDVAAGTVHLAPGPHELRLVVDSGKVNINYVDAVAQSTRPPLVIGMYNNTAISPGAETSSPANYRAIANRWLVGSKMKVDRVFNSNLPTSYASSAGKDDAASGNVSFLSVKPPGGDPAAIAAGTHDAEIRSLASSMPAGTYLTMYHEPEDNMTGAQFVAMFKRFYSVAKAANAGVTIGYVAMAYQWRPGSASTATPDDWFPGASSTDFLAVDAYDSGWSGEHSLDVQPDFQRWYGWAKTKGKPLIIAEYGVEDVSTGGFSDSVRAGIIQRSMDWVWTQPQIRMVLYWNGTSATPGGQNHYLNPTTSETTDNFAQARAAWNSAALRYGSPGTSILP